MMKSDYDKKHPAPFSLFQDEEGRWGTKDANGSTHDEPIYERIVTNEGGIRYYDGYSTVCEFSEENGMELLTWCEPWWESAFMVTHYPEEYNHYIWQHIKANTELDKTESLLPQLTKIVELSDIQKTVIEELDFYCREEDTLEIEDEEKWYAEQSSKLTPTERVAAITPLMQDQAISDDLKSVLWYKLFVFNDWYDTIVKWKSLNSKKHSPTRTSCGLTIDFLILMATGYIVLI